MREGFVHKTGEEKWGIGDTEVQAFENILNSDGRKRGFRDVDILNTKLMQCRVYVKGRYIAGTFHRVNAGLDVKDRPQRFTRFFFMVCRESKQKRGVPSRFDPMVVGLNQGLARFSMIPSDSSVCVCLYGSGIID